MPPKKPVAAKPAAKGRGRGGPAAKKTVPVATGAPKKSTGAPAKGAKASTSKSSVTKEAKPAQKQWGPQDDAALKIQRCYRGHRANRAAQKKKKEKEEYEATMDKLEKEAFIQMVKMQQEEMERKQAKEDEERRRRKEAIQRRKRLLEAAFDGDNEDILAILKEIDEFDSKAGIGKDEIGRALRNRHQHHMVECRDANENTPLSEAAAGGQVDTIRMLLQKGADPNSKGAFHRTPIYRAAFAGHLEATQVLLQHGGDPRLYADDGTGPEQVASIPAIVELLQTWDAGQTDKLLVRLEKEKEKRAEEDRERINAEANKLDKAVQEAQKEYDTCQKVLHKAHCELNKRISEHDHAAAEGFDKPELTLQAIHDAELELEMAKLNCDNARNRLAQARLLFREKRMEGKEEGEEAGEGGDDMPGLKITVKELDEVLMRDIGNRIRDSSRWPLIIDTSGQATIFLRYRDTNYLNALSLHEMEPQRIRLALLGSLRYGKFLVLDMMEVDMFETVSERMDTIQQGLMQRVMDKSIIKEENYLPLIQKSDGDDYHKNKFTDLRLQNFKLVIITRNPFPSEKLIDMTYPIRVTVHDPNAF